VRAALVGAFVSPAAVKADKMAASPSNVRSFLQGVRDGARDSAAAELREMLALLQESDADATRVEAFDAAFLLDR
jgi:Zn-dependent oligopeptidase